MKTPGLISAFPAALSLLAAFFCSPALAAPGLLDLAMWDPSDGAPIELATAWKFIPGELVPPAEIEDRPAMPVLVPSRWNGLMVDGRRFGSFGAATYWLRIRMPDKDRGELALQLRELYTSARVFLNGREAISFGNPSIDPAEDVPHPGSGVVALPDAEFVDIVIQLSNHFHEEGGAVYVPRIGRADVLFRNAFLELAFELSVIGSLAAMGLYYIAIYAVRRREEGYLLFSVMNGLAILRLLTASRLLPKFLPDFPHLTLVYIEYVGLYALIPASLALISWLFPSELPRQVVRLTVIPAAAAAICGLVLPIYWLTWTRDALSVYAGAAVLYAGFGIGLAVWRRRPGAWVIAAFSSIAGVLMLHDVLSNLHVIRATDIAAYAYLVFNLGHAIVLGRRVETALIREERLGRDLEREVRERTDHLQAEILRRAEAEAAAERASAAKSEFLSTMSHEIRTPLNGVIGIAQILAEDVTDPDQREKLRTLVSSGQLLQAIVSDILDFSKIEAGQFEIIEAPVELRRLVAEIADLFAPQARSKGLEFSLDIDPELPAWIRVDANRLRQIIANLLANAVKFTDKGGIVMVVRTNGPEHYLFAIADTGIGISQDDRSRLFQPFTQIHSALSSSRTGTGLGLSISARLTELMGGKITFISHPGTGSIFTVELPLKPVEAPVAPPPPQLRLATPPARRLKVLVVDDGEVNRIILSEFVRREGHEVLTAADGEEAVTIARLGEPDLIFMDVAMPGMDGIEAAERIRALPGGCGNVPIFAATATTQDTLRQRCLKAGMDGFLPKPIRREDVIEALQILAAPAER